MKPLPGQAAAALPEDRETASRALDAGLDAAWPGPDLLGILRRHADLPEEDACFGIWVNGELRWGHDGDPDV